MKIKDVGENDDFGDDDTPTDEGTDNTDDWGDDDTEGTGSDTGSDGKSKKKNASVIPSTELMFV